MSELFNSEEQRQEKLKGIVRELHEGSDVKAVQKRFADLIKNVSPQEIAEMEQALISEGVPVEQVQSLCEVHVQVFEQTLEKQKKSKTMPGHPVHTFLAENKALKKILKNLRGLVKKAARGQKAEEFETSLEALKGLEIHYQRKENQLFPYLEQVNFTGPSKVMWGKHDEIRAQLKTFESAYKAQDWGLLRATARTLFRAIRLMVFMEEKILFPTALKKLSEVQWAEIRRGEAEIGYTWIEPGNLWDPSVILARQAAGRQAAATPASGRQTAGTPVTGAPDSSSETGQEAEALAQGSADGLALEVGRLTEEQINLLLTNLPVDITYVDAEDKVLYYSQGRERIFPRSPAVIGREVQNCHPPNSVHIVQKILESFKKKEKDTAEFWLTLKGRFIHIRYFPLYDAEGSYRGVIEVSQDVTGIRALEGENRLLNWTL